MGKKGKREVGGGGGGLREMEKGIDRWKRARGEG